MDVLFSTPYSGALYSWFMQRKADFNAGLYEYPMDDGPYYRHALRGAARARTSALAALVMFDGVYLAAGDLAAPGEMLAWSGSRPRPRRDFSGHLGITIGANLLHDASLHVGADNIPDVARAPGMPSALRGVPEDEHWSEIVGAVSDALLVGQLGVPLICGTRRRKVIEALVGLGVIDRAMVFGDPSPTAGWARDGIVEGEKLTLTMENYKALSAVTLANPTLRSVAEVKNDTGVRACAEAFQVLLSEQRSSVSEEELRELAIVASKRKRIAGKVDRVITLISQGLALASLVPSAGTLPAPISASDPFMHGPTRALAQRHSWYQLGPAMTSAASASRILGS